MKKNKNQILLEIAGRDKKRRSKKKEEPLDLTIFFIDLKQMGIEKPVEEYKFHKSRKWRIDLCWPDSKLALEIEGGIWIDGRHNRAPGFIKDMEKYNQVAIYGFSLLRVTPQQITNGEAALLIKEFFNGR